MRPRWHTRVQALRDWRLSRLHLNRRCEDVVLALILGGDFFTGSVLASTLTKLVLRFDDLTEDRPKANALRAESKFVTVPIDKDSNERILNCIQTLSKLQEKSIVHDIFLKDMKAAYSKMLVAQEKKAAEKKGGRGAALAKEWSADQTNERRAPTYIAP
ncbi:hypothetical protein M405DRAFT_842532 [Rhizopogon salebrosus TDB-379]|nr:hypothetical protein M405DRAFT_842532 [Rhizopogon salebrosus TDB-379]